MRWPNIDQSEGLSEVWVSLGVIAGALALTGLAGRAEKRYRCSRQRSESAGAS